MHTHPPVQSGPYRLISIEKRDIWLSVHNGGDVLVSRLLKREIRSYVSIDDFIANRTWIQVGHSYLRVSSIADDLVDRFDQVGYALIDAHGDAVPLPILRGLFERRIARERADLPSYPYRNGPIAGMRRWRRYSRWLRHPATTAERRANQEAWILDINDLAVFVPVRGRRRNLPQAWDDIPIADLKNRNWKRFRKTRWRVPTGMGAIDTESTRCSTPYHSCRDMPRNRKSTPPFRTGRCTVR